MKIEDVYVRNAKVINIVDGDTLDAEVDLGFHLKVKERFRVLGIDAPEKFGPTKYAGLKAKQYLVDNLLNKNVVLVSTKTDGFRRYLADVYITTSYGSQNKLADIMIKSGLANIMYR